MEDEQIENPAPSEGEEETSAPAYRGLYGKLNIPVKVLDAIIILCIVVIVAVVVIEMRHPGFTVNFDSKGGTDVASQTHMSGELLDEPEVPTREGYRFVGWFRDASCTEAWLLESDTVEGDMTLYAAWEKIE